MFNPRKKSPPSATPLDRKQEALRQKEEQLKQAAEQLQKLIAEAPRLREERTRRRRQRLASDTRLSKTALVDIRYRANTADASADPAFGQRRLRSEKRDGKFLFLFLCVVFLALVLWISKLVMAHL